MTLEVALACHVAEGFALDLAFTASVHGATALTGPSGSGKTTVLRAIAGLDRRAGRVALDGAVWQDERCFVPPHRRRAGYVVQGGGLLPHLTVAANLDYAAARAPAGRFDRAALVDRCGVAPLLGRMPARLSGGERQRASIVRALLSQPRLLLLDEPLAGLDPAAREALLAVLADVLADAAIPVLFVTHDAAEAARLAVRSVVLDRGRVVAG